MICGIKDVVYTVNIITWGQYGLQFNAYPDPAFYFKEDPDPGNYTNADPSHKLLVKRHTLQYLLRYRNLFERQHTRFICQFRSISMLLDPDAHFFSNTDPDPGKPNECGSMQIWIRIHSTDYR